VRRELSEASADTFRTHAVWENAAALDGTPNFPAKLVHLAKSLPYA
jgi:hypothetical protein